MIKLYSKLSSRDRELRKLLAFGKFALVVIDKQKGYFAEGFPLTNIISQDSAHLEDAVSRMDDFIEYFRVNVPEDIIWIRMIESVKHSPANIAKKLSTGKISYVTDPSDDSFDYIGLQPSIGEVQIVKEGFDFLSDEETSAYLRSNPEVVTFVIIGGYTSRCVLAAAFAASSKGLNVIVLSDLVSMPDKIMNEHAPALSVIDSVLGYVVGSEKIKRLL